MGAVTNGRTKHILELTPEEDSCRIVLLGPTGNVEDQENPDCGLSLFRERLSGYIREIAGHKAGFALSGDEAEVELSRAAEEAEVQLSLLLPQASALSGGPQVTVILHLDEKEYPVTITAKIASEICIDLIREIIGCAEDVCDRNAEIIVEEISCPGDSLYAWLLRDSLARLFGDIPVTGGRPAPLREPGEEVTEAGYSYGILLAEDYDADPNRKIILNLIQKGSPLPASGSCVCYAARASHSLLWFDVYRTDEPVERCDAADPAKTFLGHVEFMPAPGLTEAPALTCRMELSGPGMLTVSVSDENGSSTSAVFQGSAD